MLQKSETPRNGGVSRNSCGGSFRDNLSPIGIQAQFLIAAHHVRPELAAVIASLAFGEELHHA